MTKLGNIRGKDLVCGRCGGTATTGDIVEYTRGQRYIVCLGRCGQQGKVRSPPRGRGTFIHEGNWEEA